MKRLFNYLGVNTKSNVFRQEGLYSYAGMLPAVVNSMLSTCLQYMVLKSTDQQGKGKGTQLFMSTFIVHKRTVENSRINAISYRSYKNTFTRFFSFKLTQTKKS
jgi:hypothetical protein